MQCKDPNILFTVEDSFNNPARFLVDFVENLKSLNPCWTIHTMGSCGINDKQNNISIKNFSKKKYFIRHAAVLKRYQKQFNFSHVVVHTNVQLVKCVLANLLGANLKIVYFIHGYRNIDGSYKKKLFVPALSLIVNLFVHRIFAFSELVRRDFAPYIIKTKFRSCRFVLPCFFYGLSLQPERKKNTIIFVAKVRHGKGHREFIQVMQRVTKRFSITFAGVGTSDPDFIKQTKVLMKNHTVRFAGHVPHDTLCELYRSHEIAVVASKSETFGFNLLEPFLAKCMLITKRVGIAQELQQISPDCVQLYDTYEELIKIINCYSPGNINTGAIALGDFDPLEIVRKFKEGIK